MDILAQIVYGGYRPPEISLKRGAYRRPPHSALLFGKRLKCRSDEPGGGLRNGMPWDSTSPCTVSTCPDNGPKKQAQIPETRRDAFNSKFRGAK